MAPSAFAMAETTASASSTSRIIGANDRIRIAVLGINGRGKTHVEEIMDLHKGRVEKNAGRHARVALIFPTSPPADAEPAP